MGFNSAFKGLMEQRPWKADWYSTNQKIPHISCNPELHYHIYKSLPTVRILSQINPVHPPFNFLKIQFNPYPANVENMVSS